MELSFRASRSAIFGTFDLAYLVLYDQCAEFSHEQSFGEPSSSPQELNCWRHP